MTGSRPPGRIPEDNPGGPGEAGGAAPPSIGRVRRLLHDVDPYAELQHSYPQDMQGWGSKDPIFRRTITAQRPKLIVEVGTWKGASAIHMAGICQEIGLQAEIVCVDTWLGNWQHWKRTEGTGSRADLRMRNGFPTLYFQFLSNVIATGHQARITPLPLTGVAAAKLFAAYRLRPDLIYIDGDHEYESVIGDLRGWLPLLNEGGMLIGDDHDFSGVSAAVREVMAEGRYAGEVGGNKFWFRHKAP
ncbi:class I SAM-dependent methyltransferase [Roseomonas sp. WA12]